MLFRKNSGIGLDIGSRKIKLVSLRKVAGNLQIERWGGMPTPLGVVDAGVIYDPERLGEALNQIVRELNFEDKYVVSAVSGSQVYTRNLVMPKMKIEELKEAVKYEATTFLPIPPEEAAMDVFPLRDFEDEEGKKVEIFFVAVRRQQVHNLEKACEIANLKLNVVDIEPLALNRVLNEKGKTPVMAFLNIGASRSYFSVFQDNILVFNRNMAFGAAPFYQEGESGTQGWDDGLDNVVIALDGQQDYLVRDIISEVTRSVEYYNMQNSGNIDRILLCGGGSRLSGLDELIAGGLNCEVDIANPLVNINSLSELNDHSRWELQHDFAVALGLAARGVL